jgi:sulfite reductase alpha subunit-like flavoprotein
VYAENLVNEFGLPRECLHLELDISGTSLRYQTGDHVGVYPRNSEREVSQLTSALGLTQEQLDTVFTMGATEGNFNLSNINALKTQIRSRRFLFQLQ